MAYTRNPRKRVIRGNPRDELRRGGRRPSEEVGTGDDDFPFVRLGSSAIGTGQDVVQRIGDAIIGGDFGGNARGSGAIDIQLERDPEISVFWVGAAGSHVASGKESVLFGNWGRSTGKSSVSIGNANAADGDYSFALGVGGQATGDYSFALGHASVSTGVRSVAIGKSALAASPDEAVIAATSLRMQTAVGVYESVITTADTPVTGNLVTWADVDRVADAGFAASAVALTNHGHNRYIAVGETMTLADKFSLLLIGYFQVDGSAILLGDAALGVY